MAERRKRNNLYKYIILYIKYIVAFLLLTNTVRMVCNYFDIYIPILGHLFGTSIAFLILLSLLAKLIKLCSYYKMIIYYLYLTIIIDLYDTYIGINVSDFTLLVSNLVILSILLIVIIILYLKYGKNSTN